VSIAACLVLYSIAVVAFGPSLLRRLTRGGHAPRCGVAAWLIAIVSVVLTWITAAVLMVLDAVTHWGQRDSFVESCFRLLCDLAAGEFGSAPQLVLVAGALAVVSVSAVTALRLARVVRRLRVHAHGHAQAIRLVGRPTSERDVFVVDAPEPTAYCVAGKPSAIVVTSAAVAALDEQELAAVLAHERAHLSGHHPKVVTALRGLALVFPRLSLMTDGAAEVSRLLEMCADDAAVRRYGHRALLTGLMALAGAAPTAALGAADVAVLSRAERLALPPAPRTRIRAQAALSSAALIIGLAPLATVALGVSGFLTCAS
jgi:Zn-dependent protease with chaperone function